jgi:hypothetical protein
VQDTFEKKTWFTFIRKSALKIINRTHFEQLGITKLYRLAWAVAVSYIIQPPFRNRDIFNWFMVRGLDGSNQFPSRLYFVRYNAQNMRDRCAVYNCARRENRWFFAQIWKQYKKIHLCLDLNQFFVIKIRIWQTWFFWNQRSSWLGTATVQWCVTKQSELHYIIKYVHVMKKRLLQKL